MNLYFKFGYLSPSDEHTAASVDKPTFPLTLLLTSIQYSTVELPHGIALVIEHIVLYLIIYDDILV